ncbi:hypothetical protein TRICI_002443 [Trichomonascus ciferrii]|uniref:cystathionine gamma-synthase n=1 Tax=Trichomonascus ciferrii TaxID=44093 RepID=A0A642V5W7_9ASCO|nr:hypothetical protein TRICI_002443 [Trichomonascus ciferrii]
MGFVDSPPTDVGCPIPANTPHAVSVTLPTWDANVGYEEGQEWVASKMNSGYPRFYVHSSIQRLAKHLVDEYGAEGEDAYLFPSYEAAKRCRDFLRRYSSQGKNVPARIVQLTTPVDETDITNANVQAHIAIVFFPAEEAGVCKSYWQHSGEGISSRLAEFCLDRWCRDKCSTEESRFLEERYGRNLDLSFADEAKKALRRRIAGKLIESGQSNDGRAEVTDLSENDVYLYPCGMASIFHAHRATMAIRGADVKAVLYGFPYVDSHNILKKFGGGVHFYANGEPEDLDAIEELLEGGEKISLFFCEVPSNPLLKTPNFERIRALADKYDFPVVVDETVGNFLNVHILPYADVVVSSLTKLFSGDSNVMGGSLVLNPHGKYFQQYKKALEEQYEDNFWAEDAIYLERNSRDFAERNTKINHNTEAVAKLFHDSPLVKDVFYPPYNPSKEQYDKVKVPSGGYGGLFSVVFKDPEDGKAFFDTVNTAKGPSLGTNFTLTSPYVILAHYAELDVVEKYGVDRHLIRISVGLEDTEKLLNNFKKGLDAVANRHN